MIRGAQTQAHHKKRYGKHQRQGKHFLKVYSPYLPMFISLAVCAVLVFGLLRPTTGKVQGATTEVTVGELLKGTNAQRGGHGKESLKLNSALDQAAQAKANDMVARDYWSHNTPDGNTPWSFIEQAGYSYTKAGENLAYGFSSSGGAVAGWMNSTTHRETLLDAQFTDVGFGYANSSNYNHDGQQTVVVAMYGTSSPSVSSPAYSSRARAVHVKSDTTYNPLSLNGRSPSKAINKAEVATLGVAPYVSLVLIGIASAGLMVISLRHGLALRRLMIKGEHYALKRPALDVSILAVLALCLVLTRVAGFVK